MSILFSDKLREYHMRPLSFAGWIVSASAAIFAVAFNLTAIGWEWSKISVSAVSGLVIPTEKNATTHLLDWSLIILYYCCNIAILLN